MNSQKHSREDRFRASRIAAVEQFPSLGDQKLRADFWEKNQGVPAGVLDAWLSWAKSPAEKPTTVNRREETYNVNADAGIGDDGTETCVWFYFFAAGWQLPRSESAFLRLQAGFDVYSINFNTCPEFKVSSQGNQPVSENQKWWVQWPVSRLLKNPPIVNHQASDFVFCLRTTWANPERMYSLSQGCLSLYEIKDVPDCYGLHQVHHKK